MASCVSLSLPRSHHASPSSSPFSPPLVGHRRCPYASGSPCPRVVTASLGWTPCPQVEPQQVTPLWVLPLPAGGLPTGAVPVGAASAGIVPTGAASAGVAPIGVVPASDRPYRW
ncbi:hypothetical protein B296_00021220 [Ensete ventricosum]|uniref:Uncharacterized protein n=1 Tax=Ensete ventricosum TaxID=4639 RepID=A0A426ZRF9_ENSVE|nr:hypothetical protein B296_00021220 [Ensete ventricosum]